jgi:predicted nucleotide-binding protein
MRILLAEDDRFYANRLTELLSDHGLEVSLVGSTEEALRIDPSVYDSAILDMIMPNDPVASGITIEECRGGYMAGVALARRIRKLKPGIKLILMSGDSWLNEAETWALAQGIPLVRKYERSAVVAALHQVGILTGRPAPRAFIVHGHDDTAVLELKDYVQNVLKWQEPIILRQQPNSGKTVIEKFEEFSTRVDCAFVLLTPDDQMKAEVTGQAKRRSRQNVIFELGFFYRHFERQSGRVIVLYKGETELPSDIEGIIWIDIGGGIEAAGEAIRREVATFSWATTAPCPTVI